MRLYFLGLLMMAGSLVMGQDNRIFEFTGVAYDKTDGKPIESFVVDVYEGNIVVKTVASEKKGRFSVDLFGGSEYTIEIFKDGYYPKRVIVRTNVPMEIKKLDPLKFEVELFRRSEFEEILKTNAFATSIFDLPYVIFEYDEKLEDLHYREEYTKNIKEKYESLTN